MMFVLTKRGEMWRASIERTAVEFVCPDQTHRTVSEGFSIESDSREGAVLGILGMWTRYMLEPLANAGAEWRDSDPPSTATLTGGYCAIEPTAPESEV